MPSKSAKQHKLMEAVAHNKKFAKKVGIPQSVGEEFAKADKGRKFGTGGSANITYGGQGQINKQRTRFGSKFGNKLNVPDESLNKYEGMATGGSISRPDLQKVNKPKVDHGKQSLFKKGGVMKMEHSEKKEMKADLSQDKKMIKRAFSMHDKQEHKGSKTDLSALKKGGKVKKMATGGMTETMGPRTMAKDVEAGSNKKIGFGQSAVQKRGLTKGTEMRGNPVTEPSNIGTKAKMLGMKKGGSVRGGGVESKGKTKGKFVTMCGGGMSSKGKK